MGKNKDDHFFERMIALSHTKQNDKKIKKTSTVRRLLVANLVAALGLLTLVVVVLFAFGLLDTIFAFIF